MAFLNTIFRFFCPSQQQSFCLSAAEQEGEPSSQQRISVIALRNLQERLDFAPRTVVGDTYWERAAPDSPIAHYDETMQVALAILTGITELYESNGVVLPDFLRKEIMQFEKKHREIFEEMQKREGGAAHLEYVINIINISSEATWDFPVRGSRNLLFFLELSQLVKRIGFSQRAWQLLSQVEVLNDQVADREEKSIIYAKLLEIYSGQGNREGVLRVLEKVHASNPQDPFPSVSIFDNGELDAAFRNFSLF